VALLALIVPSQSSGDVTPPCGIMHPPSLGLTVADYLLASEEKLCSIELSTAASNVTD
jgi:hypothetical protein